ncbi:hypothetical protein RRG08_062107 [Elysia crispata]|uniref:Methyltransferase type 11 domain-containing protein n=1 Tax=Elysia crispata TaxID=231223 RepID=A0AAE1E3Y3_9GAST|nr:hypothetical protein RRG08_062107 [Elysia crispata]
MDTALLFQSSHLVPGNVDKSKMFLGMDHSKVYVEHRPRYTDELFKTIADYCKETNPDLNLAVDVGCGPGTSTIGLAKYFQKVIGIDISETQIACAPKDIPNCEFKVGYSDKLPFIEAGTVDLLLLRVILSLVATERFRPNLVRARASKLGPECYSLTPTLAEADRVLKPGGTIAIFGYDFPCCDIPEVEACLQSIWTRIFSFAPKEAAPALERFRGLELPYPGLIRNDEMKLQMNYTVERNIEFLRSTRSARAYMEAHPTQDFLGDVAEELRQALHTSGAGDIYSVTFNLYLLMVHKPMN